MQRKNRLSLSQNEEEEIQDKMVKFRRQFHQEPELAFKEFKTSEFIIEQLREAGFEEIHTGIAETGIVAVLRGQLDESILIRADMDALPIQEQTGLPYASRVQGVMHACGHDGHSAILLGSAIQLMALVKQGMQLKRGVKFCFQPAEENSNGGGKMLDDISVYDTLETSPKVSHCFGLHLSSDKILHTVGYHSGPFSSLSDRFEINIEGKGGHAMVPDQCIDALQIGISTCNQIYQIRGKNVNQSAPCTISIGKIVAGSSPNIITDKCYISGSIRTKDSEIRDKINKAIQGICDGLILQFDCKIDTTFTSLCQPVINDPSLDDFLQRPLSKFPIFRKDIDLSLAGDDFYNFTQRKPSAYFALGCALPGTSHKDIGQFPHHSPIFQIDEACFITGLKLWLAIIEEWQNQ